MLGDLIVCVDPCTGERVITELKSFTVARRPVFTLHIEGGIKLQVTVDHPVYSPGHDSYAHAGHWRSGELEDVFVAIGERMEVRRVLHTEDLAIERFVYDLGVEHDLHNFLANGVLVHNKFVPNDISAGSPCGTECDAWNLEDCPEGEKCTAVACEIGSTAWDANVCRDIQGDAQPGEACTYTDGVSTSGNDTCAKGMMCWSVHPESEEGYCVSFCAGTPAKPVCADGGQCMLLNNGVLSICMLSCDPLASQCQDHEVCVSLDGSSGFVCATDLSADEGGYGSPCFQANACDPGFACIEGSLVPELACESADKCCSPYCDLMGPDTCPGVGALAGPDGGSQCRLQARLCVERAGSSFHVWARRDSVFYNSACASGPGGWTWSWCLGDQAALETVDVAERRVPVHTLDRRVP